MNSDPTSDDYEGTVIVPTPGGRASPAPSVAPGASAPGPIPPTAMSETGINALVAAATPVLALATRLRGQTESPDPEALRERAVRAIKEFNGRAKDAGITGDTLRYANYLLCATVDDVVLNTPWGSNSSWATHNLVPIFHKEVIGGDQVFVLLDRLQQDPANRRDLLELGYLCLSLGFEGRTRITNRGQSELSNHRTKLYGTIRKLRGSYEPDLSPNWRGVDVPTVARRRALPVWAGVVMALALVTFLFLGFSYLLNGRSDAVFAQAATLPPTGTVALDLPAPPPPPAPIIAVVPPPPDPPPPSGGERVRKFLEREIAEGLVQVTETQSEIVVRLRGQGMFASGSATLETGILPVLKRVAGAIDDEPGRVLVTGHTDNVPIQGGMKLRFPSNFHLSKARADEVLKIVAGSLKDRGRITAEGRADTEPVASNATADGRSANRRIDLILMKSGASPT